MKGTPEAGRSPAYMRSELMHGTCSMGYLSIWRGLGGQLTGTNRLKV